MIQLSGTSKVMTTEDRQTAFSVLLAAVLSVVIVGIGLLSALHSDGTSPTYP